MYRFKVGDRVVHNECPGVEGVIAQLVTFDDGQKVYQKNEEAPWYIINWEGGFDYGDDGEYESRAFEGYEADGSLAFAEDFDARRHSLFIQIVCYRHREIWNEVFKEVDDLLPTEQPWD